MSLNDPLSNVLSKIDKAEEKGKNKIVVGPNSKTTRAVMNLLRDNKYIGKIDSFEDKKGGRLEINLLGAINKIGVIKPRFSSKVEEYKKYEKRFLPAFGFGFLIVSTNKGIMTQEQATKENLGGKLIAYVY